MIPQPTIRGLGQKDKRSSTSNSFPRLHFFFPQAGSLADPLVPVSVMTGALLAAQEKATAAVTAAQKQSAADLAQAQEKATAALTAAHEKAMKKVDKLSREMEVLLSSLRALPQLAVAACFSTPSAHTCFPSPPTAAPPDAPDERQGKNMGPFGPAGPTQPSRRCRYAAYYVLGGVFHRWRKTVFVRAGGGAGEWTFLSRFLSVSCALAHLRCNAEYVAGGTWRTDQRKRTKKFNEKLNKTAAMIEYLLCEDDECVAHLEAVCSKNSLRIQDVQTSSKQIYNMLSQSAHGIEGKVVLEIGHVGSSERAGLASIFEVAYVKYDVHDEAGVPLSPSPYSV
jgi:hypothetical protein